MSTLYIASTETSIGKSAASIGLLKHFQAEGLRVGYMKPVSISTAHRPSTVLDEDAAYIHETLQLDTPVEQIAPVLITPSIIESLMRGQTDSYASRMEQAYNTIANQRDLVVLEGTNQWNEGALIDLTAAQVTSRLQARVLLVSRVRSLLAADTIIAAQKDLGDRLLGVLINQVEEPQREFLQRSLVPFLEGRGIPVFGMLPHDRVLAGASVNELRERLGGQLIGDPAWGEAIVETMMIGAMGAQTGLSFFRRRANKAVITGGDRVDLQVAALETSTNALILTGNIQPSALVLDKAAERRVSVIVVPDDTLTTVERVESLFGRTRFHQGAKLNRLLDLMNKHFDFARLSTALHLREKR